MTTRQDGRKTAPRFALMLGLSLALCGSLASAQKVAIVDADVLTERALESAPKEDRPEQLQKLQQDIQKRADQIREIEAELRRADGVLSTENLDKKRKDITRLRNEMDELEQKGRREIQRLNDLVFDPILKRVRYAIEDVALEKGIDLVLPADRAVYVGPKMTDITEDVVKRLNLPAQDASTTASERPAASAPSSGQRTIRPAGTPRSRN